jgi:hypothetical protein
MVLLLRVDEDAVDNAAELELALELSEPDMARQAMVEARTASSF